MYLCLENLGQFFFYICRHDTTTWQKTMGIWYHSSKLPPSQDHLLETYTQYRPITRRDIRYILWVPNQRELRPSIWNTNHYIPSCYILFCRVVKNNIAWIAPKFYLQVPHCACLKLDVTMTRQPVSETRDFHVKATWLEFVPWTVVSKVKHCLS